MPATLEFQQVFGLRLGGYHTLGRPVPGNFTLTNKTCAGPHHIFLSFLKGIQFALFGFRSPLLTESLLLSFPAVTKMFQFTAFLFLPEQLGDLRIKGCLRLAGAYHSLPCPSSATKPNHPLYG